MKDTMIDCKKITFEAFGMLHVAYAPTDTIEDDIKIILLRVCDSVYVSGFASDHVDLATFHKLNISEIEEWISNLLEIETP